MITDIFSELPFRSFALIRALSENQKYWRRAARLRPAFRPNLALGRP